jgi:hypothetical protein
MRAIDGPLITTVRGVAIGPDGSIVVGGGDERHIGFTS